MGAIGDHKRRHGGPQDGARFASRRMVSEGAGIEPATY